MIGHELELGRFVLEKNKWAEKKDTFFDRCSEQIRC